MAGVLRQQIRSGIYSPEWVLTAVGGPDKIDPPNWLRTWIEQEFDQKWAEEASWPPFTDNDRLDGAFQELAEQGVLVVMDAGASVAEGRRDVLQYFEELGGRTSGYTGYAYFPNEELERAMERGELYFSFGSFRGGPEDAVEVGRRVKRALEDAMFQVRWSGSVNDRIVVKGINWRRRGWFA